MSAEKEYFGSLKEKFKGKKIEYVIVAVLLVAVVLFLVLSTFTTGTKTSSTDNGDYVTGLENRLKSVLGKVDGAGKVDVIITVASGMKTVIAEQSTAVTKDGVTTVTGSPVLVSGKPIVLEERFPEIVGVLIVCDGGGRVTVKLAMIDAAVTLLNVSSERVRVLAREN